MDILKCMGLLAASIMVFVIAGGGADLHKDRSTYVEKTYEKSELINAGKVLVEMHTIIDDGITRRVLKSQILVDSIQERDVEYLNSAIKNMTYNNIVARQYEIDNKAGSYRDNIIINPTLEMTPVNY